jgi:transposase-like protein
MKATTDFIKTCPLCGKEYKGHPAISRVDNQTPICPTCGTRQALEGLGLKSDEIDKIIQSIQKSNEL